MLNTKLQKLCIQILSENFKKNLLDNYSERELKELFKFFKTNNLHVFAYVCLRKRNIKIPDNISTEMTQVYYAACSGDFMRKQQLKGIIEILNNNSIDHILLKGAALAYTVYKDSYSRLMSDFDILVKSEDASKAFKLLLENGYGSSFETVEECERIKHQFNQHYPALKKEGCLPVELHTYLSDEYRFNIGGIWKRAVKVEIDKLKTKIMSYEDLIHHIAMHKFFHDASVNGLLGLCDINVILERRELDFKELIKLADKSEYNNKKSIFVVLQLINKFWGKDFDTNILNIIDNNLLTPVILNRFSNILFNDFSNIDKDSFLLGLNMKDAGQNFAKVMNRLFMSPYKMKLYGEKKYGKLKWTFMNLCMLYIKRWASLCFRYSSSLFKRILIKDKTRKSVDLGKDCAELKYWLKS